MKQAERQIFLRTDRRQCGKTVNFKAVHYCIWSVSV